MAGPWMIGPIISLAMMGAQMIASALRPAISQTDPVINAIKITTSAFGLTRTVLHGINRLSGNMIWYGDYTAIPHTTTTSAGGKGGGQTYSQTSFTYTASFALGLCEGPIARLGKGWAGDKQIDVYPVTEAEKIFGQQIAGNWTIKTGTADQTAWAYLTSKHPTEAILYPNLAYAAAENYDLGSYPSLPNFSFIVEGLNVYYGDQENTQEIREFSTTVTVIQSSVWLQTNNVCYDSDLIDIGVVPVGVDTDTFTLAVKCDTLFVPGRTVVIVMDDGGGGTVTDSAVISSSSYSTGITTVNLDDTIIAYSMLSASVDGGPFDLVEVSSSPGVGEYAETSGVFTFNSKEVGDVNIDYDYKVASGSNPAEIITDILTNACYGLGLDSGVLDLTTYSYSDFCLANEFFLSPLFASQSPAKDVVELLLQLTNTEVIWGDNKIIFVPLGDEVVASTHATWTPDLTPVQQITYDDINDEEESSITVNRSTSRDAYNHVALQHVNRDNEFNAETTEYMDQGDIITNGKRSLGTITANGVITKTLALKLGRLLCKQSMRKRNKFSFGLPLNFIFLRPLDIIGLTSAHHGLNQLPIRITNMKVGKDAIQIEAEDLGLGSSTVPTKEVDGSLDNFVPNKMANPGNANDPLIWVPPLALADYEVWLVTAGGANWGGCHVWVSQDNTTYKRVGTMIGPCRYGALTADLPAIAASPDETNTLAVDLTISAGTITTGTEAEADSLRNLCYVDGEYISFATATLTAVYKYDIDYLVRGCYGTDMDLHTEGGNFIKLDDAVFKYKITAAEIGTTVYIKLQSFNIFGNAVQDLSDLDEHEYVVDSPGSQIGYSFTNLSILNNSVTPDEQVDVVYDACDHVSSGGGVYSTGAKSFTIDLGTTGVNGLDTGSIAADTWYYLFSIANAIQGTISGLASLSATSPTMPTGYTHKQLIGAVRTDGSADLLEFSQADYDLLWGAAQDQDDDTSAENWSDQDLGDFVPPVSTRAYITMQIEADADNVAAKARKNGSSSSGQIVGDVMAETIGSVSGWVDTDSSQTIEIYVDPAPVSWDLKVNGFRLAV